MNITIFAGARPNFIKVAPLIRVIRHEEQAGRDVHYSLVFAGRSDDPTLEPSLFSDLEIAPPDVCLGVSCENLNELTGQVMSHFEQYLQQHSTDAVVVVDDLASTMAAAIVTKKQGILLAHIAAGTRSFDISMPKEINRLVIDGLSDILFTAGISNNSIANREGAELSKVYMVGNILIDNIRYNQGARSKEQGAARSADSRVCLAVPPRAPYLVFTLNRKALMADRDNLRQMLQALLDHAGGMPVIAPLREEAAEVVKALGLGYNTDLSTPLLSGGVGVGLIPPQSYLAFSHLLRHAHGIITDSGNVAEEATFYSVPCITLNSYTEHIETVKVGSNVLVGEDPVLLADAVDKMVSGTWKSSAIPDRWDGRTAERILQILLERR